jgi:hypothetical protein
MPKIIGGSFQSEAIEDVELKMQLATVTPILPSAVAATFGTALNLGSPRLNGGMVPLALRAVCSLALSNTTLRILPTFSDGSIGTGLSWTPFTAALVVRQSIILVNNLGSIPEVNPAASEAAAMFINTVTDLSGLFAHGLWLRSLAFDCRTVGAADTASITVTYWGLYT